MTGPPPDEAASIGQEPLASEAAHPGADGLGRSQQWLMVGRLAVATLLLGGTLLLAADASGGYDRFTPQVLFWLIAATYGVTVAFAIWVPRTHFPERVAGFQLAWDLLLATVLVALSGGAASVFPFFYGVTILMSALFVGPRITQWTTVAAVLLYLGVGASMAAGLLPHPPDQPAERYLVDIQTTGFSLVINVVGLSLAGLLSTNLAERLRRAGGKLRHAQANAATLARLNDDIVRSLASGLITTDLEDNVLTINPAGARMLAATPSTLVGEPLSSLLPITIPKMSERDSTPIGLRGEAMANRLDDTTFPVGYTVNPLLGSSGQSTGMLVSFQDLTEIKDLRHAAERADRLATLGRLSAGMAHEIRNPLSAISGAVQLIREEEKLNEEDQRLLGLVLDEVGRLDDLVTTMLQVGRPNEPTRAQADLATLAEEVVDMAARAPAFPASIRIAYQKPSEPVSAWIDPNQVRQVIWNLLKNATQAAPSRSTVTVKVASSEDHMSVVEVTDQGKGIDDAVRGKLFDAFYSGRTHGVGLGLALVQQIVDSHGGTVDVESQAGHGATFRVSFPSSNPNGDAPPSRRSCLTERHGRSRRPT